MCGFAGYINFQTSVENHTEVISKMTNKIVHRGPDDSGIWIDPGSRVVLGHRRLSILDLSSSGHQPMISPDQESVIIFNGEIYNHLEIRKRLEEQGCLVKWVGHSDTETLLTAINFWGIENALKELIGMFSFVFYEIKKNKIILARDRFGEKPLYYGWIGGVFVFSSELKAIQEHPEFDNTISKTALAQYLRFSYVPAPQSIFNDIYKLEPGKFIDTQINNLEAKNFDLKEYWSLSKVIEQGSLNLISDEDEAITTMETTLSNAVKSQMLSDVPLGAFLSGGVDSSTIVAIMQKESISPVQTFTIGFDESDYDESVYAKDVANHLGTDHNEFFVTSKEALEVIPSLPTIYDEPFADPSQIPTFLVSKIAKQKVTVALSGDGGDEIFGGYNRYFWGPNIWSKVNWLPFRLRKIFAELILQIPIGGWSMIGKANNFFRPGVAGISSLGDKAYKLSDRLKRVHNIDELYLSLVSEWQDPSDLIQNYTEDDAQKTIHKFFEDSPKSISSKDSSSRMMYWDSVSYLPDDILCKVDRAAMATSLETRVPFLDHRVAELAWRLPLNMKIKKNQTKWILRSILYKYVPENLIERPKAGFGVPVGDWLRGPLREWAEDLLSKDRLVEEGNLKPDLIRRIWEEHLSGNYDWTPRLWSILMFQSWLENQK